ncbi:MAG: hypothetical protein H0V09_00170, partial [Gemmatimonadetes bacterium]|nr:hypothetical protein [Gemmatimonadota bacterium]
AAPGGGVSPAPAPPPQPPVAPAGAEAAPREGFSFAHVGDVQGRAQRLARALVSDILVYNPKKVEQGVREGNLRDVLKEEVDKSWDEYCERLGTDVARANRPAFVSALNDVLARGNPVF